jgi:hypothetical protein
MSAEEVMARYTEQARGDISEFITEHGAIDWEAVRARGHLVKRVSHRKGQQSQIELYDAQHALDQIGKALGMFTERVDVTSGGGPLKLYIGVTPDDWDEPEV